MRHDPIEAPAPDQYTCMVHESCDVDHAERLRPEARQDPGPTEGAPRSRRDHLHVVPFVPQGGDLGEDEVTARVAQGLRVARGDDGDTQAKSAISETPRKNQGKTRRTA